MFSNNLCLPKWKKHHLSFILCNWFVIGSSAVDEEDEDVVVAVVVANANCCCDEVDGVEDNDIDPGDLILVNCCKLVPDPTINVTVSLSHSSLADESSRQPPIPKLSYMPKRDCNHYERQKEIQIKNKGKYQYLYCDSSK